MCLKELFIRIFYRKQLHDEKENIEGINGYNFMHELSEPLTLKKFKYVQVYSKKFDFIMKESNELKNEKDDIKKIDIVHNLFKSHRDELDDLQIISICYR